MTTRTAILSLIALSIAVAVGRADQQPLANTKFDYLWKGNHTYALPIALTKQAAAPTAAPGAGRAILFVVAGTTGGTCALKMMAGTSTTAVTVSDNVGTGC